MSFCLHAFCYAPSFFFYEIHFKRVLRKRRKPELSCADFDSVTRDQKKNTELLFSLLLAAHASGRYLWAVAPDLKYSRFEVEPTSKGS